MRTARLVVLLLGLTLAVAACGAGHQGRTSRAAPSSRPSSTPGPGGVLTVLGLGDSVMAGTACHCAGPVAGYARAMHIRTGRRIVDVNLGSNGATTTSLLHDLTQSSVRRQVSAARVVLVIVGANDLLPQLQQWTTQGCPRSCYLPAVHAMGQRLDRVLDVVTGLRPGHTQDVVVADYWNVFTDGKVARESGGQRQIDWSRAVSRAANRAICGAAQESGNTCADTYTPFVGGDADPTWLLAVDGDHPNAKGVSVLVDQLVDATPKGAFD